MQDKEAEIYRCGKELFSARGFKDTSVTDITRMAGLGVGTFYLYYRSKEQLFFKISLDENEKLKRSLIEAVDLDAAPLIVMRQAMAANMRGIATSPILREWYNKDIYHKLERSFREEHGMEQLNYLYGFVLELIKRWQAEGRMRRDIGADMILALISCIFTVDTHKEEIGIQHFPEVLDHLATFIMNGLTGE